MKCLIIVEKEYKFAALITNRVNMLSKAQVVQLSKKAHHLEPVVLIGQKGLTENVLSEIDRALTDHHLIKVKAKADKEAILGWSEDVQTSLGAHVVKIIGKVMVLYREPEESDQI